MLLTRRHREHTQKRPRAEVDLYRGRAARGGAVAELALVVDAPAPHRAVLPRDTGVPAGGRDVDDVREVDPQAGHADVGCAEDLADAEDPVVGREIRDGFSTG